MWSEQDSWFTFWISPEQSLVILSEDFHTLNAELSAYHASLGKKPQIVALNKIDLPEVRSRASQVRERLQKMGYRVVLISGRTGEGIDELMNAVTEALESIGVE